ncbi:MAG: NAD(P)/FAD-dependent oxidoreductase, partial [Mycobacteriales bacterium]
MTETVQPPGADLPAQWPAQAAAEVAAAWVADFAAAVGTGSAPDLESLFASDATWRDFMALAWDFTHSIGREELVPRVLELVKEAEATGFTINDAVPPAFSGEAITAFFDFTSRDRIDRGYVLLVERDGRFVASMVQT